MMADKKIFTDNELMEYLETIQEDLVQITSELAKAEKTRKQNVLQNISRMIHSIKGSSGSFELNFVPVICHNIEDALQSLKEHDFGPAQMELTNNLLSLLEDYFTACQAFRAVDEDFAVRLHSLFSNTSAQKQSSLSGLRALIVEDTQAVAKKIVTVLSEQGIHCSQASNGLEAFNRIAEEFFDVVITSQSMKKISGTELIELLKISRGKNPDIKTCLISSSQNLEFRTARPDILLHKDTTLTDKLLVFLKKELGSSSKNTPIHKTFKQIMLVDDDPVIRSLLHAIFKNDPKLHVEIVASGAEAINKVQNFKPEIVVLDCMMPEMTGPEVFEKLRADKNLKETRFFFLTGKTHQREIDALLNLGADGVLLKPFSPHRLLDQIKEKFNAL